MKLLTNLNCANPPLSGVGHYTRQLLGHLMERHALEAFAAFHGGKLLDQETTQSWLDHDNDTQLTARQRVGSRVKHAARQLPLSYSLRNWWQQRQFERLTRPLQDATYWEPGLSLYPFAGKRAATIYDLSHIVMPSAHPPSRVAYLTRQIDQTLQSGCQLLTISNMMQREIAAYAGIDADTIGVVPPAAHRAYAPLSAGEKALARQQLCLPQQYILALGTLEPRKNLPALLSAFCQLPKPLRQQWPLVCVGGQGWGDNRTVANTMMKLQQAGELYVLGYVPQQHLPAIVACAELLAYTSLYEGFGMPVVEAMACGVPVLTSQDTSMHDIVGDAGFLVNPYDIDDMRHTLSEALQDANRRERYAALGIDISKRYTWAHSADRLYHLLTCQ
ncbi:glycosyltransferase family 1 protein [Halomonas sp. CUBES01]|uniref:Glycosyltransferase family 1 protein n=1 Tax=Vreelandella gomseomensis TaxID=370766 RepID=A0ABU1GEU8_9GAMM|nr:MULTISPECIES: glycosyltransferase family 1 protein [Halomonas]MDR5876003.1 glycosyltransferase family 1 protein [Halomonas gomseomensis]MEC4766698.1 glycosyltransferase family 1 protein [Halomonas sp. CUBES01]